MSEPFIGEICIFAGNFAPRGWAFCDGQLLPISTNTALFSILGTTYGGDGRTTFALPNMAGAAPMHPGRGPGLSLRTLGQRGGSATVTLSEAELPGHAHRMSGTNEQANQTSPGDHVLGMTLGFQSYRATASNLTPLATEALAATGGSQAHDNMQPYLVMNFIIALQGLFPPRG